MKRRRDLKLGTIGLVGLLFLVIVSTVGASPAAPQMMNYQGQLSDSGGNPLNGAYSITFGLYNGPSEETAFWTETHTTVSVANGLFNVLLGSSKPLNRESCRSLYSTSHQNSQDEGRCTYGC